MATPARVVLKPRRARPFFARHPWVFADSIARVEGSPEPGAEVVLSISEGQFIARGLWNPHSAIRVRLYRWTDEPIDAAFLHGLIDEAIRLRTEVLKLEGPGTAARLVFSESDGLSGLIVDRFDRHLVVQFTSRALHDRRDTLLPYLADRTGAASVTLRGEKGIPSQEGLKVEEGTVLGTAPDGRVEIIEDGVTHAVTIGAGQKTGFYLDQRDNRQAVSRYAAGRKVLDLFCYTGGFALHTLIRGGATSALGIDSSTGAIETARGNAIRNQAGSARFEAADVLEVLDRLRAAGENFGLVVCDPPKYARGPRDVEDAVKGYLRLNLAAVSVVEPGGILATCSCSGLVGRELFLDVLAQVAERSGRRLQILAQLGQSADHPVAASCLETEYLKCIIARVV